MVNARASEFLEKAEKWLRWCDTYLQQLIKHADEHSLDDVERVLTTLLGYIATVHEALISAASCADLTDWEKALEEIRETDALLFYIWKARNTESHNALVKWHKSPNFGFRIVDSQAAFQTAAMFYKDRSDAAVNSRLLFYILETSDEHEVNKRLHSKFRPSEERCRQAGVVLEHNRATFMFMPFSYRKEKGKNRGKLVRVPAPEKHLGNRLPAMPEYVLERAIAFYRGKYQELIQALGPPPSSEPQSPQDPPP